MSDSCEAGVSYLCSVPPFVMPNNHVFSWSAYPPQPARAFRMTWGKGSAGLLKNAEIQSLLSASLMTFQTLSILLPTQLDVYDDLDNQTYSLYTARRQNDGIFHLQENTIKVPTSPANRSPSIDGRRRSLPRENRV